MILTDEGKLGIGNFDPSATLSVSGSVDPTAIYALGASEDQPTVEVQNLSGLALMADSPSDVSLSGGGVIQVGASNAKNIAIDQNEIMARNNGGTSPLYLNLNGGDVRMGPQQTKAPHAYGRFRTEWNGSSYDFFLVSASENVTGFTVNNAGILWIQIDGGVLDTDVMIVTPHTGGTSEPKICRADRSINGNDLLIQIWGPENENAAVGPVSFVIYRP